MGSSGCATSAATSAVLAGEDEPGLHPPTTHAEINSNENHFIFSESARGTSEIQLDLYFERVRILLLPRDNEKPEYPISNKEFPMMKQEAANASPCQLPKSSPKEFLHHGK